MIQNSKQKRGILSHFDLFGVEIGLIYNNSRKFTSRFGGLISLILSGILIAFGYQLVQQMANKQNPNSIYQQIQVQNPIRQNINKSKFSFAIQFLKDGYMPYIDNTVFTVEGIFTVKTGEIQADGQIKWKFINLIIAPCESNDFQIQETNNYFKNLSQTFCIKNQDDLFLEGQWEQPNYTDIKILFKECTGINCKEEQVRQNIIKKGKIQVYFTDKIIDQQNFEKPFQQIGKTLFYNIFYDYYTNCGLLFQTTHVYDDVGLITYEEKTKSELQFSKDRVQLSSKSNQYFFQVSLYLEKDKEQKYIRTYLKLPQMISQLGGVFNVLFLIGSLISRPYNRIQLLRNLFSDIFQIEQKRHIEKMKNKKKKNDKNEFNNQKSNQISPNKTLHHKLYFFISSQLSCFKCFSNELTTLIKAGQEKINNYLSINYIINKFIQYDNLKNVILHSQLNDSHQRLDSIDNSNNLTTSFNITTKGGQKSLYLHEKAMIDYSKELIRNNRSTTRQQQPKIANLKTEDQINSSNFQKGSYFQQYIISSPQSTKCFEKIPIDFSQNLDCEVANENQNFRTRSYKSKIPSFLLKVDSQNSMNQRPLSPIIRTLASPQKIISPRAFFSEQNTQISEDIENKIE